MYLEIKKNKIKNFEKQIEVLAPWMHSFKFTENLIVATTNTKESVMK